MNEREFFHYYEHEMAGVRPVFSDDFDSPRPPQADIDNTNRHELLMNSPWVSLDQLKFHDNLLIHTVKPAGSDLIGSLYLELIPWHDQAVVPSQSAVRAHVLGSNLPGISANDRILLGGAGLGDYMPQNGIIRRDCELKITQLKFVELKSAYGHDAMPDHDKIAVMVASGEWEQHPQTRRILVPKMAEVVSTPLVTELFKVGEPKDMLEHLTWQPASTFNTRSL